MVFRKLLGWRRGDDKGAGRGVEKGAELGAEKGAELGDEGGSKGGAARGSKRGVPRGTARGTPRSTERGTPRGAAQGETLYLIVGLGNPGKEYEATRHNAGFKAADRVADRIGASSYRRKFRALVAEGRHAGARVAIVKPQTYMNVSGASVAEAIRFYKVDISRLVVIFDDVDIPLFSVRVRAMGGPGTHKGMSSVIAWLGGKEGFPRVRIGIGKQPEGMDIKDYVLGRVRAADRPKMDESFDRAASAALDIVEFGVEKAMSRHNAARGAKA